MKTQVAIIGAGLSGLYAALLLSRAGIVCKVLESRDRIGGRILSVGVGTSSDPSSDALASYDLGPAWIWPDAQPLVRRLVAELGIEIFPQHTEGAIVVERSPGAPPQRYARGFNTEPPSMRMVGGMRCLAEAVASRLPPSTVHCGTRVTGLGLDVAGMVHIEATGVGGQLRLAAESAILALPPRLASRSIRFTPNLSPELQSVLDAVPTWMAGHAKVMAIYELPFWRAQGFSGAASSAVGPLAEIHDASPVQGHPALFGFVGLPPATREAIGRQDLQRMALAQLVRLFGPAAASPVAVKLLDWAAERETATLADRVPPSTHPLYGPPPDLGLAWKDRLALAGTEVATQNGGYLEGALEAAVAAVDAVSAHIAKGFGTDWVDKGPPTANDH